MESRWNHIKYLLIDEKSMIGRSMLGWIDQRLRDIRKNYKDIPFGGVNVLLFGDDEQLSCIGDNAFFDTKL